MVKESFDSNPKQKGLIDRFLINSSCAGLELNMLPWYEVQNDINMNMAYRKDFDYVEEKELNSKFPGGCPGC